MSAYEATTSCDQHLFSLLQPTLPKSKNREVANLISGSGAVEVSCSTIRVKEKLRGFVWGGVARSIMMLRYTISAGRYVPGISTVSIRRRSHVVWLSSPILSPLNQRAEASVTDWAIHLPSIATALAFSRW
jgi:hypothetical protein